GYISIFTLLSTGSISALSCHSRKNPDNPKFQTIESSVHKKSVKLQLKQTLTRYHAASLEIVMHRDNVYLNTEVMPDAELGKERRKQLRGWSAKGREERGGKIGKYTEQDENQWIDTATDLKSKNPVLKSARELALKVISKLNMPESSYESVRKCLSKNGFKRNG
ncbi:hypothetical protein, partial [Nitrosomonas sp.]|uniref:hypothetical protein n=1 Tax=Nitrosomonas sp. TaxID=42353 RepID=UPI00271B6B6E